MKALDNKKVFVSTPETSKAVQKKAFKLGYYWSIGQAHSTHTEFPFLYFNPDNTIGYSGDFEYFREHRFEKITAEEILAMEAHELEETFKIFQKVLVRNEDDKKWTPKFYREKTSLGHVTIGREVWDKCIDYKKNKHLAFTTKKPGF